MHHLSRARTWGSLSAALLGLLLLGQPGTSRADESAKKAPAKGEAAKLESSLKFVPADAAFYSAMLHNREQLEAILHSRAWARIKALPAYKMAEQQLREGLAKPDNPLGQMRQVLEMPENRDLVELLKDMGSSEIFVYGDHGYADFFSLLLRVSNGVRFVPYMATFSGKPQEANQMMGRAILHVLSENEDLIKVPNLVIGFKLADTERAEAQLKRLETLVNRAIEKVPPMKGRLKHTQVAGGRFLTLTMDGSQVPLDQIPFEDFEEKAGQFDALKKKLAGLTLTISIGVRDQYLLVLVGGSNQAIEKLGQGKSLMDRPEFKPLEKYADRKLVSVAYVSKEMASAVGMSRKDVDTLFATAKDYLKKAHLPEDLVERVDKDMTDLSRDVKSLIAEPGAVLSFAFLNGRGEESYTYDWGEHPRVDASKPLDLLQHAGGSPILVAVGRAKYSPEHYQMLVKWVRVASGYVEDYAVPNLNEDQKEKYDQLMGWVKPMAKRLDEATGKAFLPALADGQVGLVLDAQQKSKHWFQGMPEADKPLPLPEPAIVLGVSDRARLVKAMGEYRAIANEALAKARELSGGQEPEIKVPAPETKKVKSGELYYYPLPKELGLDPQLSPNAGLSGKVAVLSLSQGQSERLLASTPLKVSEGPLADNLNKPLAAAAYVDWPALIDAAGPWVEYAIGQANMQAGAGAGNKDKVPSKEEILEQVRTVLEVMKVLRGYSSCTYLEGGALVTHGELVIQDLEGGSD